MCAGCNNCYIFMNDKNYNRVIQNKNFSILVRKDKLGRFVIRGGQAVSVCQKSDFFIEEADMWRPLVWEMIKERKDLHFLIMTRRVHRIKGCLPSDWHDGYPNVSITLSIEDQASFLDRVPEFLKLRCKEKTIMICPLLGEINLRDVLYPGVDISYINCGGENYTNARPIRYEHIKKLSADSLMLGIPFYFYDTGAYLIKDNRRYFIPKEKRYSQAFLSNLSHN